MGEFRAVDDDQHVGLGGDRPHRRFRRMRRRIFGSLRGMAAKPMIARSPSGNRLGSALRRHLRAADAGKATRPGLRRLMRGDQRGAEPIAGFLAGHQEDMRSQRGGHRSVSAGDADDENVGAVGRRDQPLRLGDDRSRPPPRRCRQVPRARRLRPSADRSTADRSAGPGRASAPSPARRCPAARACGPLARISATRASIASVPSAASTASTWRPATTTACPTSNGPVARR